MIYYYDPNISCAEFARTFAHPPPNATSLLNRTKRRCRRFRNTTRCHIRHRKLFLLPLASKKILHGSSKDFELEFIAHGDSYKKKWNSTSSETDNTLRIHPNQRIHYWHPLKRNTWKTMLLLLCIALMFSAIPFTVRDCPFWDEGKLIQTS